MRHEPVVALKSGEHGARFLAGKDDRNFRRALRTLEVDKLKLSLKHLLIKKKQGAESLILSRSADPAVDGEVREKSGNFVLAHVGGVPLFVKKEEAADPIEVSLLGAD